MKNRALFFLAALWLFISGCSTLTLDKERTASAPWKVGEVIKPDRNDCFIEERSERFIVSRAASGACPYYRKFLGIDVAGHYVMQDFFTATDTKYTDPYFLFRQRDAAFGSFGRNSGLVGKMVIYDESGKKRRLIEQNDLNKRHGAWREWDANGVLRKEEYFQNGELEGVRRLWLSDGQILEEIHYKAGWKDGFESRWYKNGQKEYEYFYIAGDREGLASRWYDTGEIESLSYYKKRQETGRWTKWFIDGKIRSERYYKDGREEGIRTEWKNDGSVRSQETYRNGRRVD